MQLLGLFSLLTIWFVSGFPTHAAPLDATKLVYQFPNETWVENIAGRNNGHLLVTLILPFAGLYEIDPKAKKPTPRLIHNFTPTHNLSSLLGVVEESPNIFYVAGSDLDVASLKATPGSNFNFKIDFSAPGCATTPKISTLVNLRNATLINGIASPFPGLLYAADSAQGVIWAVNTTTGTYTRAIDDPMFKVPSSGAQIKLGINGIKVAGSTLYFTNSATSIFGKIHINRDTGAATSKAVKIYRFTLGLPDDFTLDKAAKNAYVADATGNSLVRIDLTSGKAMTVAGNLNSTGIAQPTSAAFGRLRTDSNVVYVTTAGGAGSPVNGHEIVGGQVVAVTLV